MTRFGTKYIYFYWTQNYLCDSVTGAKGCYEFEIKIDPCLLLSKALLRKKLPDCLEVFLCCYNCMRMSYALLLFLEGSSLGLLIISILANEPG